MKKASFGHLVFSSRTSRWFYVFWALVFLLFILLDAGGIIDDSVSEWLLVLIVVIPIGVYSSIAYGRYQITPDFLFVQDIRSSKQYKWEHFEGYEIRQSSIIQQIFTSAPQKTLELFFSEGNNKRKKIRIFSADPQLIQALDAHLS